MRQVAETVALHPEGVDRNILALKFLNFRADVALHPEGVDRNRNIELPREVVNTSPSTRRAWIEISVAAP